MARQSRRVTRRPRNMTWHVSSSGTSGNNKELTSAKPYLLATIPGDSEHERVVQRSFGALFSYASAPKMIGVIAAIVLPDILIGSPTPFTQVPDNFPSPTDDEGTDDWLVWSPFSMRSGAIFCPGADGSGNSAGFVQSKARRTLGKDEVMYWVLKIITETGTAATDDWAFVTRVLTLLKD